MAIRVGITAELTRPRGSANPDSSGLHAKHAPAARVQRFVRVEAYGAAPDRHVQFALPRTSAMRKEQTKYEKPQYKPTTIGKNTRARAEEPAKDRVRQKRHKGRNS
jgi:hypothetical protein